MKKYDERIRYTFRIPKALIQKIREEATRLGSSVNATMLQILWKWYEEQK